MKRKIKLTECDLYKVIKESVKKIVKENIPRQCFRWCGEFHEGYVMVCDNDKFNFIDTNKKLLSPNQWFDSCEDFHEGCARVELNGKYNFINTDGNILSPNQWFDFCGDTFSCGYVWVKLGGEYNYIDTDGNLLSPNQWFKRAWGFYKGYADVILKDGSSLWIDTNGNISDYNPEFEKLRNSSVKNKNESLNRLDRIIKESVRETISEIAPPSKNTPQKGKEIDTTSEKESWKELDDKYGQEWERYQSESNPYRFNKRVYFPTDMCNEGWFGNNKNYQQKFGNGRYNENFY